MDQRRFHLGCGSVALDGFVNVDIRPTDAADLVIDLEALDLAPGSADLLLSHAFFEHLRRSAREPHLRSALRALASGGALCYLGLPDFEQVARLYLDRAAGVLGPVFDLFEVYRYTHGDPEQAEEAGWYFEQLHKSLFDCDELDRLFERAGFPSYLIFSYVYPGEQARVNLGVYASKSRRGPEVLIDECTVLLRPFDGRFLQHDSLVPKVTRSHTLVASWLAAMRGRREEDVRRLTAGVARRLRTQ